MEFQNLTLLRLGCTRRVSPPAEIRLRTEALVTKFWNDNLKIPVIASNISIAHRLPRGKFDKHRPIIVRFTSRRMREKVYCARNQVLSALEMAMRLQSSLTNT